MTEEHQVLICMPTSIDGYVVPGSLQVKCHRCPNLVWVSPSSWLMLSGKPQMEILCWACAGKQMKQEPGKLIPLTSAQMEEIQEYQRQSGGNE